MASYVCLIFGRPSERPAPVRIACVPWSSWPSQRTTLTASLVTPWKVDPPLLLPPVHSTHGGIRYEMPFSRPWASQLGPAPNFAPAAEVAPPPAVPPPLAVPVPPAAVPVRVPVPVPVAPPVPPPVPVPFPVAVSVPVAEPVPVCP